MGNRKQPFGYRMTLGEITILPEEANLVRLIFQGYGAGATLGELTKALCQQEIPYYAGRTWNKNMVSRILEDERYIGEKGYPVLIEPEQLRAAAAAAHRPNAHDGAGRGAAAKRGVKGAHDEQMRDRDAEERTGHREER